jgi:glycosyltransferase involved in cell wall biosynthesis
MKSILNQTLKEIEIIMVDDGSKEECAKLCDKFAAEDSRVRVIHKENGGLGFARNTGLSESKGEYVGFVDSDDYIEPLMCEELYTSAVKNDADIAISGLCFVGGNMFSEEGKVERKDYFKSDTHFETEDELKKLRMGIVGATPEDEDDSKYGMSIWKNLFRRKIIEENKITFESEREMLSEDSLFMIDYISHIKKATGINEAFYNYYRNEDSISKSYKKDRFEKSLVFADEVEKRFKKDIAPEEYQLYIDRFWQAICRVICSQEIMHSLDNNIKFADLKKRLKQVCTHSRTVRVLKTYPIAKLPFKQMVFAVAMKYRLYRLMKLLVLLRK